MTLILIDGQQYIRALELHTDRIPLAQQQRYPFSLPAIRSLGSLAIHPHVTFIVGENGSGKSTLLEAIAVAFGFNPEGGTRNFSFATRSSHSELHQAVRLIKGPQRPRDGFFLRAESFYNVATNIEELDREGGALSRSRLVDSYGGRSLHEQSHGEAFFATFLHRFGGQGLYLLDEPEAALSPTRQMALISRIHQLVQDNSQLIIATHSPIIMAYPDAAIWQVTERGFDQVAYEQTEHYAVTKEFINNHRRLLAVLMEE